MREITVEHKGKTQKLEFSEDPQWDKVNTIMVVGPGYYGYGESVKVAKKHCIEAGCPRKAKMLAFMGDEKLGVDGLGRVQSSAVLFCLGEV